MGVPPGNFVIGAPHRLRLLKSWFAANPPTNLPRTLCAE